PTQTTSLSPAKATTNYSKWAGEQENCPTAKLSGFHRRGLGCPRAPTTSITPNGLSGTTGKAPGSTITMRRSDAGPTLTNVSPMTEQHRNLVLMRHAKSAYPDAVADHGRPLSSRGVRESGLAGDWLRANLPAVDAVLCSTATRARETLAGTGVDAPVRYAERLYGA